MVIHRCYHRGELLRKYTCARFHYRSLANLGVNRSASAGGERSPIANPYKECDRFWGTHRDGVLFKDIADSLARLFIAILFPLCWCILWSSSWLVQGIWKLHQSNRSKSSSTDFSCGVVAVHRSLSVSVKRWLSLSSLLRHSSLSLLSNVSAIQKY